MIKISTIRELEAISYKLPDEVRQEATRIIRILDESYHQKNQCGGYLFIGTSQTDFDVICNQYPHLKLNDYEFLDYLESNYYVSLLYILSADDSLSIIIPKQAIPSIIWQEAEKRKRQ